ncbi:MAG: outer membrane beta-barrel protein [Vicinamibacterales bacterium]|jgi:OOP family OmpA-OmpF porin|nr:outer membrane beta-barrel protein [Vicinamibacterales bacterium]
MNRIFALTGLALLVAAPANAVDRGFYAGLDVGQHSYDLDANDLGRQVDGALGDVGLTLSNATSDTSEDGFTYGVLVGYQFLPYLAVEAAYVDLGDAEFKRNGTVSDGVTSGDLRARLNTESSGPSLSALGILPFLKGWEAHARAGVYFGSNDATASLAIDGVEDSASDSTNSTEFVWGAGIGYTRGKYTCRLDYQQYVDVGDSSSGETNIDRLTVVAIGRF